MRVLIFTEGGSEIGLGHISRCSSLYNELLIRNINVKFIVYGDFKTNIVVQRQVLKTMNWQCSDFLNNYIKKNDYCIIDSYKATENLYKLISQRAKKSLFIDDNARIKYPKGIVVNPSLTSKNMQHLYNDCNFYLNGPEYIILRKPFIKVKRAISNSEVKEVLITLGGSNIQNILDSILNQICNKYLNIRFNVIIGSACRSFDKRAYSNNINFYKDLDAEEMKNIMLKSDIAITAAGQTIYELLATQTPFIPIKIVDNQSNNIEGLLEFKLVETIVDYKKKYFIEILENEFQKLLVLSKRKQIINLYENIIDGLGSRRIIDKLISE